MSIQCSIPVCSINTGYKNHANKKRNEKNLLQPTETTLKQKEAAKGKTRQGCFGQRAKWMKWKWNEMRVWVTDGLTMNLEGRKVSQSVIHSFGVRVSELVSGRAGKWVGLSLLNKLSPPSGWLGWLFGCRGWRLCSMRRKGEGCWRRSGELGPLASHSFWTARKQQ